uniref:universal stress protein n=1 Tax=Streptomyces malaysiensis TaxID=92644 RepID=UPI00384E1F2B
MSGVGNHPGQSLKGSPPWPCTGTPTAARVPICQLAAGTGPVESWAAAEWAAREAALRDLPVKLVHVRSPVPGPMSRAPSLDAETYRHWTERVPREAAEDLIQRHPGVEVSTEQRARAPADVLVEAARDADLPVLGSRAPSGLGGFLVGSVGQSVVRRNPFGAQIGAVTHGAPHHATAPVAVVAHD